MARKTTDQLKRDIKKMFKKMTSDDEMERLGARIVQIIKHRTRYKGQGVGKPFGNRSKINDVSDDYARWRRKPNKAWLADNKKHSKAARGKASNLTLTGAMLDELKVVDVAKDGVLIGWDNPKIANQAAHVTEAGRPFMNLGRAEIELLLKDFDKRIKQFVKNI